MIHFCLMPHDAPGQKKRYPNSGIITKKDQERLEANPKSAPYGGSLDIDCPHCKAQIQMWINAWVKEFADGRHFFSLSFNPKNGAPKGPKPPVVQTRATPAPAPQQPAASTAPAAEPFTEDEDYRY